MHVFSDAFWVACDNYQTMQHEHLHRLETATLPDLERLVFEREQHFAAPQNSLTAVAYQWQTAPLVPSFVHALQVRLTALQEGDAVLTERLHAYRATLEQARAQIQQGQKLLGGYGSQAATRSPRVVDRSG